MKERIDRVVCDWSIQMGVALTEEQQITLVDNIYDEITYVESEEN